MIGDYTLARPYAKSAFAIAQAANKQKEWSHSLEVLSTLIKTPSVWRALTKKIITEQQLLEWLIKDNSANAVLFPEVENLLKLLVEYKRLLIVPQIYELFFAEYNEFNNILKIDIISSRTISVGNTEVLQKTLQKKYSQEIKLSYIIDADLIGGTIIKIGNNILDYSIKGKLQQMQTFLEGQT